MLTRTVRYTAYYRYIHKQRKTQAELTRSHDIQAAEKFFVRKVSGCIDFLAGRHLADNITGLIRYIFALKVLNHVFHYNVSKPYIRTAKNGSYVPVHTGTYWYRYMILPNKLYSASTVREQNARTGTGTVPYTGTVMVSHRVPRSIRRTS